MWKIFFFKNLAENESERLVQELLLFSESGLHFIFNIFAKPQLGQTIKKNCITVQTYDPDMFSIKGPGARFSKTFCLQFFKKNISHIIFY